MTEHRDFENANPSAAPGSEAHFTVLVLPGLNSWAKHWQTLWEQGDARFRRVQQKDWLTPQLSDWVEGISQAVAGAEPPIFFAAHSLGSIALAHWAQTASPSF